VSVWVKLAVALVASTLAVAGCAWMLVADHGASTTGASDATATAARAFFDRYLDADGRVVRRDQGGDTVSEGQSYALLLAAITDDRRRFDLVWSWTTTHLQRPDGLLSWRYADGAVADPMSASDADLQAAWALSLAAQRFGGEPYASNGRMLAGAILDHESVVAGGSRYVAAGPWATSDPAVVEPGYGAPTALIDLGHLTGDLRWNDVAATSRRLGRELADTSTLPPDWVSVDLSSGQVEPVAAPDHSVDAPRYGLDAARLVAWLAIDCDSSSRATAGRWSATLSDHPLAQARDLSGASSSGDESAASEAVVAVATRAAGDNAKSDSMLAQARRFDQDRPTYYGAAWVALAYALADAHAPLGCPSP
jgi:endoglucanase